ncbi:MAG: DNA-directed RNA polymerase subunit omega [Planctomycetota bacterium]
MIEDFDIEELWNKCGGAFRLTILVQKRMRQLIKDAPRLVDSDSDSLIEIAFREIQEGKIKLEEDIQEENI